MQIVIQMTEGHHELIRQLPADLIPLIESNPEARAAITRVMQQIARICKTSRTQSTFRGMLDSEIVELGRLVFAHTGKQLNLTPEKREALARKVVEYIDNRKQLGQVRGTSRPKRLPRHLL